MRITVLISGAIALCVLAGQAASADPHARNHGINQRQENQQERVRQGVKSAAVTGTTRDPLVNARQQNQKDRIVQGAASGELTRTEAKKLVQERRDIKQLEQTYKSDGTLTTPERKDLHQQLDQAGKEIREEKHDPQQR